MPNRIARAAAALSLAPTAVLILRIIAIGEPGVFVILIPALTGALLAIWRQDALCLSRRPYSQRLPPRCF